MVRARLGWGVEGVAIATLIAEWSGLFLGLWLCRDALKTPAWRDWPRVFDRVQMIQFARVNRDILLRSVVLQGIFLSFVFLGARFRRCHFGGEPRVVAVSGNHRLFDGRFCDSGGNVGRPIHGRAQCCACAPRRADDKLLGHDHCHVHGRRVSRSLVLQSLI